LVRPPEFVLNRKKMAKIGWKIRKIEKQINRDISTPIRGLVV
jgi:hypothetical protein